MQITSIRVQDVDVDFKMDTGAKVTVILEETIQCFEWVYTQTLREKAIS